MYKVTAIILNYNSSDECKNCLDYLYAQDYAELSIIIVDNNSSKKQEEERLRKICKTAKLIVNSNNGGFSAGNNIGLKAAVKDGADWMLIINPDVELRDPHYISYVMEELKKWSDVAVVGTNVLLPDGNRQNPMRELTCFEEIFWPIEIIKQKLGLCDGYHSKNETGYCEKVSGCCFFISKDFLLKNNYLDEHVFMYCEEPILAKSVIKHGYRELYIKEVTANHEHYNYKKQGNSTTRMPMFIKSRIYYIQNYSEYGKIIKKIAIISRKVQLKFWEGRS